MLNVVHFNMIWSWVQILFMDMHAEYWVNPGWIFCHKKGPDRFQGIGQNISGLSKNLWGPYPGLKKSSF